MQDYITVASFTRPTEAAIIKGKLESEGIDCILKDELTVQVYNFYSNAIGGVKLQVNKNDIPLAIEILKESGYAVSTEKEELPFWIKYLQITDKIPFLKRLSLGWRLITILCLFMVVTGGTLFYYTQPSQYEILTKTKWCVDIIGYNGKSYRPYSTGVRIIGYNFCNETLELRSNGKAALPGFNSPHIYGDWVIEGEKISILNVDSFPNVYSGEYEVDISLSGKNLTLTSSTTSIHCYEQYH